MKKRIILNSLASLSPRSEAGRGRSGQISNLKSCQGFSLIELLVALVIISIMLTIGITSYQGSQRKARDARRQSDLRTIQSALEHYHVDQRAYPSALPTPGNSFRSSDGSRVYLNKFPDDPLGSLGTHYLYVPECGTSCQKYTLCSTLEALPNPTPTPSCGTGYHFKVSMP